MVSCRGVKNTINRFLWIMLGFAVFFPGCVAPSIPLATLPLEHPGAAEANLRGIDFYQQGKWEQALAQFQKALSIDPDFPEAHFNLALALH